MAKKTVDRKPKGKARRPLIVRPFYWVMRWVFRLAVVLLLIFVGLRWINPPLTMVQALSQMSSGANAQTWVALDELPPHLPAAFVAAEDAKFCAHHGFDIEAIRQVLDEGQSRGASTITQQTVKNVFLWQGRSWVRKGLEAGLTPLAELIWGKQRILEIYVNVAQTDVATFGVEAGAQGYFGKSARALSANEAARLASVLPSPATRSALRPNANQRRRLSTIQDGAATILKDGRADCFLP